MKLRLPTYWEILAALFTIGVAALLVFGATGCRTVGVCERLAIAEERREADVFRVHYWWWDADACEFKGHARNYKLHADGTRSYYDVGGVHWVPEPTATSIGYDSYKARVIDGQTNPPTVAPRR